MPSDAQRVVVIGGGIAGLAAAHRLRELDSSANVQLLEASDRLGGVIRTSREGGYLLEHASDSFITNIPWGVELCRRLGLAEELIETDARYRRALVLRDGRLHPVPDGFSLMAPARLWPILTTPLLSWRGKLRLLREPLIAARRDAGDESLSSFVRRRLGNEAFERLVQPLVGGIYTADAEQLSMAAALPRFREMERQHGSLFRAMRQPTQPTSSTADVKASGARYSLFVTLRDGLSRLVEALAALLPPDAVRLNTAATSIRRSGDGWQVALGAGAPIEADAVVVATPAPVAAKLLQPLDASLSDDLAGIPYAGCVVALVGYRREQVEHPLEGFGFVVPEVERRRILSVSFSSRKFAGRAPEGSVLLRVFLGGATRPEMLAMDDDELCRIITAELGELLGARGEPELLHMARWPATMPQYHLGHVARVERIETRLAELPQLQLAGNALHGVGIPQCIHSGELAAERLMRLPTTG